MQLSHKDVVLDYFSCRNREIDMLMSGQELEIREAGCFWGEKRIIQFSAKFHAQMRELKAKNYFPAKAIVRKVVYWQGKERENEIKIILPDVEFSKINPMTQSSPPILY